MSVGWKDIQCIHCGEPLMSINHVCKESEKTMQESLKPCPHCGQPDDGLMVEQYQPILNLWRVVCSTCTARVNGASREEAIARWNRRVTLHDRLTREPGLIDELLRELDLYGRYQNLGLPLFGEAGESHRDALRALVLAWAKQVEDGAQDGGKTQPEG